MHSWTGRCTIYELKEEVDESNGYISKIVDGSKGGSDDNCIVTRVGNKQFSISGWDCDYLLIG